MRLRGREVGAGMELMFLTELIGLSPTKTPIETALKVYPCVLSVRCVYFDEFFFCICVYIWYSAVPASSFNASVVSTSHAPGVLF